MLEIEYCISHNIFGHSAGAQFAHRFLMFKPQAKYNRIVAASAGWYTMQDNQLDFPYGLKASPIENDDLSYIFSTPLTVMIGTADNDPNAPSLRHTSQAEAQGANRLERAQYFFTESRQLALVQGLTFNWQYKTLPLVGHDFNATGLAAADLLFN